jgi:hypothetical protein
MPKHLNPQLILRLLFTLLVTGGLVIETFGQTPAAQRRDPAHPRQDDPFGREIDPEANSGFIKKHSFDDPDFRKKRQEEFGTFALQGSKRVRMVYLIPSDRAYRKDYQVAIGNAILHLQNFYQAEVGGGYSFSTHAPIVEVYTTSHPASFYSSFPNNGPNDFFSSVLADGFALSGGGFNDPNNRWIYYVDADPACGQNVGGVAGVALLPANDLRGLTGEPNVPPCGGTPDSGGVCRWIGGLGHELGHAFGLPHPPGCDQGSCAGGTFAFNSLMYFGFSLYPNTYLLQEDKNHLLNTGFFTPLSLDGPRFDCAGNPIDDQRVFARLQYLDILGREPDQGGWDAWAGYIYGCGADAACLNQRRITTARGFLESAEFRSAHQFLSSPYVPGDPIYDGEYVRELYRHYLLREPEQQVIQDNPWYIYIRTHPGDYDTLVGGFINSSEYRNRFQ